MRIHGYYPRSIAATLRSLLTVACQPADLKSDGLAPVTDNFPAALEAHEAPYAPRLDPGAIYDARAMLLPSPSDAVIPGKQQPGVVYECPAGATFTHTADRNFCAFDVRLPDAPVRSVCDAVEAGVIGFGWRLADMTDSHYACPDGFFYQGTTAGRGYCLAWTTPLPKNTPVRPYCDALALGAIGFSWSRGQHSEQAPPLRQPPVHHEENYSQPSVNPMGAGHVCPDGTRLTSNGHDRAYCLIEGIDLPDADVVEPFCHWVHQGWLGFSWADGADSFECPAHWERVESDDGETSFCMYELSHLPKSAGIETHCHRLYDGVLGFEWPM